MLDQKGLGTRMDLVLLSLRACLTVWWLQAEHAAVAAGEEEKPHVVATTVTTITAQSTEDTTTKERTQQVPHTRSSRKPLSSSARCVTLLLKCISP